jgi:ribosomal protein S18 acetylase RimI-like enzyme
VTAANEAAVAMYTRCGFRRTGESKPLDRAPGVASIRMARDLL